jgi:hypothetical protein
MKIVLLSLSIGVLGFFALQNLPAVYTTPDLRPSSPDTVQTEAEANPKAVTRILGHR